MVKDGKRVQKVKWGECRVKTNLFGRKVDALGVASTLDVENAMIRPNVLVVSDQLPLRISRQSPNHIHPSIHPSNISQYSGNQIKRKKDSNSRLPSPAQSEE